MSCIILQDGLSGVTAKVDNKNRLGVASTTTSARTQAAIDGDQFSIESDIIELTSGSESALLFIKNIESTAIVWAITNIVVTAATSTGGSGQWLISFNKNASLGTLISAGTDVVANNLNLGSAKPLAATIKQGVEGSTITDGSVRSPSLIPVAPGALNASIEVLAVPQGTGISVFVTPPAGNTSMNVKVQVTLFRVIGE